MELMNGRPADFAARLPKEQRVYELLDGLGMEYLRVDHEAAMTMEACIAVDEALGATMCKNLMLCNRQCTDFYLLLMPGDKPFKTCKQYRTPNRDRRDELVKRGTVIAIRDRTEAESDR